MFLRHKIIFLFLNFRLLFFISVLVSATASLRLECSFGREYYNNYHYVEECYVCIGKTDYIKTPETAIDGVDGDHVNGKSLDDVNVLRVSFAEWHYIPKGPEDFFRHIEVLDMQFCHLKAITQEDLRQFPTLFELYLVNNDIKSLDPELFLFNRDLKFIDVTRNKICSIAVDLLDPIDDLKEIRIDDNLCVPVARNKDEVQKAKTEIFKKNNCPVISTNFTAKKCPMDEDFSFKHDCLIKENVKLREEKLEIHEAILSLLASMTDDFGNFIDNTIQE